MDGEKAFYVLCILAGVFVAIAALKFGDYWIAGIGLVTMLGAAIAWKARP